jgi:hypothetical protein
MVRESWAWTTSIGTDEPHPLDRAPLQDLLPLSSVAFPDDDLPRARPANDLCQHRLVPSSCDLDRRGTGRAGSQRRDDGRNEVRECDQDPVSAAEPIRRESRRELAGAFVELLIGQTRGA